MENASKALLIAGAILIAIILISVGMLVLNSTTNVRDQVGDVTASQAVQAYNNKFSIYAGEQKGSAIKQLLSEIAVSNETHPGSVYNGIYVEFEGVANDINTPHPSQIMSAMSSIDNSVTYNVKITWMDTQGYIRGITISTQ